MHWADSFAKEIAETRDKKEFVVESGITPSGVVHVGNAREIMTQFFVYRALHDIGKKAKFIYMWDDFDRFRKVPKGVPEDFGKYIGMPVSKVPDPFGCHKTYAEHYKAGLHHELKALGIHPMYLSATEFYEKCLFAEQIRTALEKTQAIKEILNSARAEELTANWLPIHVYCEKCGKDTTQTNYLGGYQIEYTCDCGFVNVIDFRKTGIVKLKWRIDWPSRWAYFGVDFESAGKDHMASSGSWDTGTEISRIVFSYEPPVGTMYEFIYIKGQKEKMSKSVGNVATLTTLLEIYEPEIVRFMYTQRLKKAIHVPFDLDIYGIYDAFDSAEKAFFGLEKSDDETKRRYELSRMKEYKRCPTRISFAETVNLLKTVSPGKIEDTARKLLIEKREDYTKEDFDLVMERVERAKFWLENYAPSEMKTCLNTDTIEIPAEYKPLVKKIAQKVSKLSDEEEILQETYELIKASGFKPKDIFALLYKCLTGKDKGPRFGILVMILGKEAVVARLEELAK